MKNYTLEELSNAETYTNDPALATLARKVAMEEWNKLPAGTIAGGDYKRQVLSGQYPQPVKARIEELLRTEAAEMQIHNDLVEEYKKIVAPANVTMQLQGNIIRIATPWDGNDLGKRLSGKGAHWDDRGRAWEYPLDNVLSLPRIFANWQKSQASAAQAQQQAEAQRRQQREAAQRQRETQWAEERRQNDAIRQQQRQAQAVAVAQRVRVLAGQYKIGQILNGSSIISFGKSWTESDLSRGQLYQECDYDRCDGEPVCVDCFKCSKHCGCGSQITYCYAYF